MFSQNGGKIGGTPRIAAKPISPRLRAPVMPYVEKRMDLNDYLIREADTTFFVRIKGNSMDNAGIHDNDVVIVDRSQEASIGDIVLASLDGEFTVKTLAKNKNGSPRLLPANEAFSPIEVLEGVQFQIWGVVTGAVRKFK